MTKNIVFSHFSSLDGKGISARLWRAKKTMPIFYPNKLFCPAIASHPRDGIFMFAFEDDLKRKNSPCPGIIIEFRACKGRTRKKKENC
jgi:hypothetical protein